MSPLFDLDDPPAEPPESADPLVWRLAHRLWCDHQSDVTGFCTAGTCRRRFAPHPCDGYELALEGLAVALGVPTRG